MDFVTFSVMCLIFPFVLFSHLHECVSIKIVRSDRDDVVSETESFMPYIKHLVFYR